ncbi:MAG TPA: class I SAM-dependent methyltransferase [Acidobacteriota bacterium]|nr:class I SAM-dependent methyltransferase [Acidobacteriota bacterium]
MANRTITLTDELYDYLLGASLREPALLRQLRAETASHPMAVMQISPEQGQFMALLARLMGARRMLEIGVFTGYSSLVVALALPPEGRIIACDVSEEYTSVAQRYWEDAGVADKIDLRLGPAVETLDALIEDGQQATFDMAFIDADKKEYDAYYERALQLVRAGGLIAIDNVLWSGAVLDESDSDEMVAAIRALNAKLRDDDRVDLSMLPLGDGLTLAAKR